MKTPIVMLAAAVGIGLAAPAFATDRTVAPSGPPLLQTDQGKSSIEVSSQETKKKKKKKATTSRSSWGG